MNSRKYSLNKTDLFAILKVLLWSGASAVVAALIAIVGELEVAAEWGFVVTAINGGLYALQKYMAGR